MPRASDYLVRGYTYHLTHRCHDREYLLRFVRDRNVYQKWLREGAIRHRVPVYGFCITSNHVHVVIHAENEEGVSWLMHLAAGSTAKQYNLRKDRLGSMWEHPYHCTLIEDESHLFNCLCYVDLNMVRAGKVLHPKEWRWCGYDELVGQRRRYRFLDVEGLVERLHFGRMQEFREAYVDAIARRLESRSLARESWWTESLAVGSKEFVTRVTGLYGRRIKLDVSQPDCGETDTWILKESTPSYGSI